jgi:tetratricopeptide (TPR) repeat protein
LTASQAADDASFANVGLAETSPKWSRPNGYASIALYTLLSESASRVLRKYPQLFLTTIATLAFTVGCSSTAQTPADDDQDSPAIRELNEDDEGNTGPVLSTTTTTTIKRVAVTPQAEPGFIKVSKELREAIGSIGQSPAGQSIDHLQAVRKNLFAPAHEKQLSAYVLAGLLNASGSSDAKQQAFNLYIEAAANDALSTPARIHAADIAAAANDEKKVQEVLAPLLKKAQNAARSENETKPQGEQKGVWHRTAKRDPALPETIYRLGESYYRARDMGAATNVFERVRELFPDTEYAIGASWYLGTISLETEQDWKTALKEFRHYLSVCPQGKNSIKIVQLMIDACQPKIAPGADPSTAAPAQIELTPNDRALIAMALYKHGRFADALATWDQIGSKHIYRSVCLMKTGKRAEGVSALLQSIEADPKNGLMPEVASAFCKPVPTKDALALWQEILKRNPAQLDDALWNVAKRLGATEGAPYYARLIAERPTSEFAPESAWWLVWSEAKQGYADKGPNKKAHFAKAFAHCDKAMKLYSNTHIGPKFAFWRGKLHETLGRKAEAAVAYEFADNKYPGSYYGYRSKFRARHLRSELAAGGGSAGDAVAKAGTAGGAAKSGRIIPDRKWSLVIGRANPDPGWTWPEPPALFHWQKLPASVGETSATLLWLRQYDEAFKHAIGKVPQEVKAWVLLKQGQILKANANASVNLEGYPQQTPRWRFAFPLAYGNIVEREARKRSLDPLLIHGLIRQESRYDHTAVSRSNAMGLMQLLKGTAYGVAKHNGIALNATQDIFKPDTNIQLGTAYVAYVLKRAEGNAMLAVASYNGGPNAVAKWLKQHQAQGISDMDVYVENIPYDETRDYVRKVFAHYWNYEHLYNSHHSG